MGERNETTLQSSGELTKGRRRKAPKPERRDVPKTAPNSKSSLSREDTMSRG
jgi:hypothetical protein